MMPVRVVGDSITYYVAQYGGVDLFADRDLVATIDGRPGARADSPTRWQRWIEAVDALVDTQGAAVYALGTNDVWKESHADPDRHTDPDARRFDDSELATCVAHVCRALTYSAVRGVWPVWVNVTERTLSGWYNGGARHLNAEMRDACTANEWGHVDWNALRAPTRDLVHPKPDGVRMWVDAVAEVI